MSEETRPDCKRQAKAKHEKMEKATFLWFTSMRAKNVCITQDIMAKKVKEFGDQLGVTDFAYSNGWVTRFKRRYGISSRVISGESAGVDETVVETGVQQVKLILADYSPKDVYNMAETGLFYQMLPDRSLTTKDYVKGTKKQKARIVL